MADSQPPADRDPSDLMGLDGLRVVTPGNPHWVDIALEHLGAGGIVALPTETVYGLAASLELPLGVERIFALKKRTPRKALPWQTPGIEEAERAGFRFSDGALSLCRRYWPGPLTLVLPRPSSCPKWYAPGSRTVALRVPDHPAALALLRALPHPLAVTSANESGSAACVDAKAVAWAFAGCPHLLVVDGGTVSGGRPSTVVDATGSEPVVLRDGPILGPDILETWHAK